MSYILKKTNGTVLTTVNDGSIDQTTSLIFVGKNYAGYGGIINDNLVKLLENFANSTAPSGAILTGQLWYDTLNKNLKVFDGTGNWKSFPVIVSSAQRPTYFNPGDLWFNNAENTFWVKSSTDFIKIGPQQSTAATVIPITVLDNTGSSHDILEFKIGNSNVCVGVISNDNFVINAIDPISSSQSPNFSSIKRGITLAGTDTSGRSTSTSTNSTTSLLWGTASHSLNSDSLGGIPASSYLLSGTSPTTAFGLDDNGILVGITPGNFRFHSNSGAYEGKITAYGQKISFNMMPGLSSDTSINNVVNITSTAFSHAQLVPGATTAVDLGTLEIPFSNAYVLAVNATNSVSTTLVTATNLTVTGTATAPTVTSTDNSNSIATTAFVREILPFGVIVMWYGASNAVPAGWQLCNGTNGTPNLVDRFVVGAGNTYGTGGAVGGSADAIVVAHSHSVSSSVSDLGHSHAIGIAGGQGSVNAGNNLVGDPGQSSGPTRYSAVGITGIGVTTVMSSTGSSPTNANLPPYFALAYIMKM